MATDLHGKRYAILAENGFEESELIEPLKALRATGAKVDVISPQAQEIQGMRHDKPGEKVAVDVQLERANPEEYDGLVLPGGVMNPDALRINEKAVNFVRSFIQTNKPVAAICHGPWTLIEADAVRGRTMTSWPSLRTDLRNAGANWVNQEVVRDGNLVTSRNPQDLSAFCQKMIELFQGAAHKAMAA